VLRGMQSIALLAGYLVAFTLAVALEVCRRDA
jgi:hypothetical protein